MLISYVLKDEKGKKVNQARIHEEIQWHIDECKRRGERYCGILAPWGHGKTEQVVIGRTLDEIGKNPNVRIFIVTNTDDNSKARVSSIIKYILYDKDYQKVYPNVEPAQGEDWTKHKIIVKRDSKSKDGTVEAWGVTSSGTGSRCDMLLFDDPVDMRNAISNPAMRPAVKDCFKNVWLSRLVPNGMIVYIATVWHQDDNTSEILKNKEWKFLIMKVSEDFHNIECESPFKGKYSIPLWDKWNDKELKQRFALIGKRAFNRGFRQIALSDEDRTFPSSDKIFRKEIGLDIVQPHWPRIAGIDPFGKAVVIFTLALSPQGLKVLVSLKRGRWSPKRTIDEIIKTQLDYQPHIFVCENNAAQEAIRQWAEEKGHNLNLVPFTTGKQKADPQLGLPSLEVEFANDSWIIPYKGIDPFDNEDPINIFKRELSEHPLGQAEDTVMACWFAREGARLLMHKPEAETGDEIITQEELGVEPVRIGDY